MDRLHVQSITENVDASILFAIFVAVFVSCLFVAIHLSLIITFNDIYQTQANCSCNQDQMRVLTTIYKIAV